MNAKLAILQRRMNLQPEKAPVPEFGLGAQIEALVADAVQAQVADALEQRSPKVHKLLDDFNRPKPVTDYQELPPVQKTTPAKNISALIHRDAAGVPRWIEINGVKFEAMRDGAGVLLGIKQIDESPLLPAPDIPFMSSARQYQPGEPR